MNAPDALYWPQNLEFYSYLDKFDCYLEYQEPDLDCNYHGGAQLIHAFAGGVEITDFLSDSTVEAIERAACLHFWES